jgi:hypothetical protein
MKDFRAMAPVAVRVVRNVHLATVGLVIEVVHVGSLIQRARLADRVGRGVDIALSNGERSRPEDGIGTF